MKRTAYGLLVPDSDTHFGSVAPLELGHIDRALQYVKDFEVAVDGGAHVGAWSIKLAERFKVVVAFEPDADNFKCLKANTPKKVECYPYALGKERGKGALHAPVNPGNSGAGWVVEGDDFDVMPLDDLVVRAGFLKLDVEGYEPFAIEGARRLIEKSRPVILVEQKQITARYGLGHLEAGKRLEAMGYVLAEKLNKDYVYVSP